MTRRVRIEEAARDELAAAVDWYEEERLPGLLAGSVMARAWLTA